MAHIQEPPSNDTSPRQFSSPLDCLAEAAGSLEPMHNDASAYALPEPHLLSLRLPVVCGSNEGLFIVRDQTFLCSCEDKCRLKPTKELDGRHGVEVSGTEFERHSGQGAAKKWKSSVKVINPDGTFTSVGVWLDRHNFPTKTKGTTNGPAKPSKPSAGQQRVNAKGAAASTKPPASPEQPASVAPRPLLLSRQTAPAQYGSGPVPAHTQHKLAHVNPHVNASGSQQSRPSGSLLAKAKAAPQPSPIPLLSRPTPAEKHQAAISKPAAKTVPGLPSLSPSPHVISLRQPPGHADATNSPVSQAALLGNYSGTRRLYCVAPNSTTAQPADTLQHAVSEIVVHPGGGAGSRDSKGTKRSLGESGVSGVKKARTVDPVPVINTWSIDTNGRLRVFISLEGSTYTGTLEPVPQAPVPALPGYATGGKVNKIQPPSMQATTGAANAQQTAPSQPMPLLKRPSAHHGPSASRPASPQIAADIGSKQGTLCPPKIMPQAAAAAAAATVSIAVNPASAKLMHNVSNLQHDHAASSQMPLSAGIYTSPLSASVLQGSPSGASRLLLSPILPTATAGMDATGGSVGAMPGQTGNSLGHQPVSSQVSSQKVVATNKPADVDQAGRSDAHMQTSEIPGVVIKVEAVDADAD